MPISFLGVRTDGQTDTVLESSYGNMSAHKKFQLKAHHHLSDIYLRTADFVYFFLSYISVVAIAISFTIIYLQL